MPERIDQIRAALDQGPIMVPSEDINVAWMAMIQAQRSMTDVLKGMADQQRNDREQLGEIAKTVHSIDKRLVVIENNSIERDIRANARRIDRLEERVKGTEAWQIADGGEKRGMSKALDAILRYGPFIIAVITALFIVLVATKRIVI